MNSASDNLLKREQFAVNLRKQKKQVLLQSKRKKLTITEVEHDDSILNCDYQQYVLFRNNPELHHDILNAVAPYWSQQLTLTDQVNYLLSRVDFDGDFLHLFAITFQLRILTIEAPFNIKQILRQTTLGNHCAKLLSIWTESKEVYFI